MKVCRVPSFSFQSAPCGGVTFGVVTHEPPEGAEEFWPTPHDTPKYTQFNRVSQGVVSPYKSTTYKLVDAKKPQKVGFLGSFLGVFGGQI